MAPRGSAMVFAQRRIFSNRRASGVHVVRQPRIKLQKLKRGARRGVVMAMRLFVEGCYTNSNQCGKDETHGEVVHQAGHASRRKSNSHP